MTLDEFRSVILPALGRFGFPHPDQVDAELLWRASLPRADWTAARTHDVRDAQDALLGRWPDAAVKIVQDLRTNYEALRRAQSEGAKRVRLMAQTGCRCFGPVLDGVELEVEAALRAFAGDESTPLLPPPQAPCVQSETPWICSLRTVPVPEFYREGDDPEFAKVLQEILRPTPPKMLASDWAERIRNSMPSTGA